MPIEWIDASMDLIETLRLATNAVRCTYCGAYYDLARVEAVFLREHEEYLTPCCDKNADTRQWVSVPSYRRVILLNREPPRVGLAPIRKRVL
jgi:hypothetical protein